jgi:hypothetical protein
VAPQCISDDAGQARSYPGEQMHYGATSITSHTNFPIGLEDP